MSKDIMEKYWDIIDDTADIVIEDMKDTPEDERQAIIDEAIDRSLTYYEDQATILGAMLIKGVIEFGKPLDWEFVWEEMQEDIYNQIKEKKGE